MKFRTFLLGFAALFVAVNAAYFSISGLSSLFAGASTAVIVMASSLELAKLISAGFLYNYWTKINKLLRTYLMIGTFVLILITSAGIYGFLTSAYQVTADEMSIIDKQTEILELKKDRYETELLSYTTEKNQLNESINELSKGLSNNVIQYKDKETGEIITTTSSSTRRVLQSQLEDSKEQRDKLTLKEDIVRDTITSLDIQILDLKSNNEVAAEIGPLRYISNISGMEMDDVVNWFAMFIVFVFDPLAVTLVIAFSTAMKIDKGEKDKSKIDTKNYKVYNDTDGLYDTNDGDFYDEFEFEDDEKDDPHDTNVGNPDDIIEKTPTGLKSESGEDVHIVNDDKKPKLSEDDVKNIIESNDNPPEPNQKLKEAFKKYKDVPLTDINNEPNPNNPAWIEYDNGGWKNRYKENEYFYHPWFDWSKPQRWLYNKHAVDHWLKYKGGTRSQLQKYRDIYPDKKNMKYYS